MGKKILIIKNIPSEGPGLIEDILNECGIKYSIFDLSKGQNQLIINNYGAVIVLGGPDSANDDSHKIQTELALIREVLKAKIPYLGICLGLQTFVKAAGGEVVKNGIKEVGFRDPNGDYFDVELTIEGHSDPLFTGLDNSFRVFHLHGETVNITENMILLATGKYCRNQIVKFGLNSYGIQFHFELTSELLETWIKEDPDLLKIDAERLRSDFEAIRYEYFQSGNLLFQNFLRIAGYSD
jgi:GMP synthase (glutamine-hydrolysing)